MLSSYWKITVRNLLKHKLYTFINIFGLAVGIACTVLIFLFVHDEFGYDTFHENADQIYRLNQSFRSGGVEANWARSAPPWAPNLVNDFPEVHDFVRLNHQRVILSKDDKKFYEPLTFFADSNFFDFFNFTLREGDPSTALQSPQSIILTEAVAKKYFGNENPLGQQIEVNYYGNSTYTVTGIMDEFPAQSHFHADVLLSFSSMNIDFSRAYGSIGNFYSYLRVERESDIQALEEKFPAFIQGYLGGNSASTTFLALQPLTDIHLKSNLDREIEANGDILYVYIFSAIAILIFLIACINFINLTTAKSSTRAKEIGVKKVLGAYRKQLIFQFLYEAVYLSVAAVMLAVLFIELALPAFNDLTGKMVSIDYFANPLLMIGFLGIILTVGLLAGSYPAFYLASFHPLRVIKAAGFSTRNESGAISLRKTLILLQFSISIALIISSMVVYGQLDYLQNKKLGFDKEHVLVLKNIPREVFQKYDLFREEIGSVAGVLKVAASMEIPSGRILDAGSVTAEGITDGLSPTQFPFLFANIIDKGYIEVLDVGLIAGENLSGDDNLEGYLLNESAVRAIGWDAPADAVGKLVSWRNLPRKPVVGVISDFNFSSLHHKIDPLIMLRNDIWFGNILVRVSTDNIRSTVSAIEEKWQEFYPEHPFTYVFLDELFDSLYKSEDKQSDLLIYFSGIAIIIACLGLFGLSVFIAQQKVKEVGIRKVLGASIPSIVLLMSKEISSSLLLANIVAWPITYFAVNRWLEGFVYRFSVSPWLFIIAGVSACLVAVFTIGYQSIKSAMVNPVDSLRSE